MPEPRAAAGHSVPFYSAAAANAGLGLEEAVQRVLARHWYVLGEEVRQFEDEFARYVGVTHCITVANGTDALELALRALGIGPGQEVLCTANAGYYASAAAHAVGARARYAEIDPHWLTLSPVALEHALAERRPAAVIATHLYGQLAEVERIAPACLAAGVPLIEDCAQAHGAIRNSRRAGASGTVSCFSFYPTKNLAALGDGGAVLTNDDELAQTLRSLRQYGWSAKYEVVRAGGRNSRLDELQAAALRARLPHLERQNAERRAIAARYNAAFSALPLQCPASVGDDFVAHLYVVRCEQRDALQAHLLAAGVGCDVHYPIPDHRQPVQPAGSPALPVTEAACDSVLSLPCYPGMTQEQVARVIDAVGAFFRRAA